MTLKPLVLEHRRQWSGLCSYLWWGTHIHTHTKKKNTNKEKLEQHVIKSETLNSTNTLSGAEAVQSV